MTDWATPGGEADVPIGIVPPEASGEATGTSSGPISTGAATGTSPGPNTGGATNATEDVGPFDRRGPIPLRPLTVADIVDSAFEVVRQRPRASLLSALALTLPLYVIVLFLQPEPAFLGGIGAGGIFTNLGGGLAPASGATGLRAVLLVLVLTVGPLFVHACMGVMMGRMVQQWYLGADSEPTDLLRFLGKRLPAVIGSFILIHLAEIVGVFMAIVGVILVMAFTCLNSPVLGMESQGAWPSLRRSASLASRNLGKIIGVLAVSWVLSAVLGYVLLPLSVGATTGGNLGRVLWVLSGIATLTVTTPIMSSISVFLYLDTRVRAEGLDLELRAGDAFGTPR